ncbi:FHA domain-containing protein, partial [Streptomyces sp. ISL-1]|uniref:FHA domain-containing protein n=1 Tax=Streptomyces sp. ISL-1 TaxID=2817657 RepID=UPI001BE9FE10
MQIRLTVLAPRSGQSAAAGQAYAGHPSAGHGSAGHGSGGHPSARRACDVLITAPAGTALATVASGLAAAVSGPDVSGQVVLYAGQERLDAQRRTLGEPPLVDGAVLSLQVPHYFDESPVEDASAQLHVVAGPDAGGVHLLHGGQIRVGRSADADVPLDDPDVSRLHCAVTVAEDGRVTVADLGSTNGTTLDGTPVSAHPVRLPAGALLRLGESTLRLAPYHRMPGLATAPDGEGHLRVTRDTGAEGTDKPGKPVEPGGGGSAAYASGPGGPGAGRPGQGGSDRDGAAPYGSGAARSEPGSGGGGAAYASASGSSGGGPAQGSHRPDGPAPYGTGSGPGPGASQDGPGSPGAASHAPYNSTPLVPAQYDPSFPSAPTTAGRGDAGTLYPGHPAGGPHGDAVHSRAADDQDQAPAGPMGHGTPAHGTRLPEGVGRRRGISAWARRLTGGREERVAEAAPQPGPPVSAAPAVESWPDPAAVLLTALGPGPRLWERGPGHPESLVLRLGTADRAELPAVPVTVGLREAGSLGLAGPRARLAGLARSAVAQLAALHSPVDLEIVLISADRTRSMEERRAEWAWLGWLPHLRPAHGQDCRLLLAYDRDQATARTAELTRRLDDGPLGPGWPSVDHRSLAEAAARYEGARTVLIVDGDPGSAVLRETTARLAGAGWAAGIHLVCLAETPAASAASPVAATYETACAASLAFRECGAVALLSGDVATALRLMRTAGGQPAGHGTVGAVDAVSAAWAERFGRALAPLRAEGVATGA